MYYNVHSEPRNYVVWLWLCKIHLIESSNMQKMWNIKKTYTAFENNILCKQKYCFYSYNLVEKIIWRIPCDISRYFFGFSNAAFIFFIFHIFWIILLLDFTFSHLWISEFFNFWIILLLDLTFSRLLDFWTFGFFTFPFGVSFSANNAGQQNAQQFKTFINNFTTFLYSYFFVVLVLWML